VDESEKMAAPQGASDSKEENIESQEEAPIMPSFNAYDILNSSIAMFSSYAWRAMGLMPDPHTKKVEQDLEQARIAVDCAALLVEKLETRLQENEKRELRSLIQDLRINFVKQLENSKEGGS
jgi:hypothetical protein